MGTQLDATPGVLSAVMSTVDGRAFAHASRPDQHMEVARISAISSSLLALAESFGVESLQGRAQYSNVVTDRGTIVIVRVPTLARAHVLSVLADNSENFAMVLRFSLDLAEQLAGAMGST